MRCQTLQEPLLQVRDVSVTFANAKRQDGSSQVLRSVSFDLAPGERLGLLGESGSGKSTCAKALLELLPPSAKVTGEIKFAGHTLLRKHSTRLPLRSESMTQPSSEMAKLHALGIQMVFQDPFSSLDPRQRIHDALVEVLTVRNINLKKLGKPQLPQKEHENLISSVTEEVGLCPEHLCRLPSELSGGQLQRIAIARALLLEPQVLVADEAVSALDLSLQAQIITLLEQLCRRRNLAVLFISHDLKLVRYFCDRVIVLSRGEIVDSGDVEHVFNLPQSGYTRELISSAIHRMPLQI